MDYVLCEFNLLTLRFKKYKNDNKNKILVQKSIFFM